MTRLLSYLTVGTVAFLGYVASEVVPANAQSEVQLERNKPYKTFVDLNHDGRKDIVFENGALFLQTRDGKYERVTRHTYKGRNGFLTKNHWFYDTEGNMFDLRPAEPRKRIHHGTYDESAYTLDEQLDKKHSTA